MFMVEREWLEAAQAANKAPQSSGGASALAALLEARLAEGRKKAIAAALAAAAAPPAAAAAEAAAAEAVKADAPPLGELRFADAGSEATATVRVPAGTKAKHVRCEVKELSLKLEVATLAAGSTVVAEGELFQKVLVDECNWTLQDVQGEGRILTLSLQKAHQMTWLMLLRE